MIVHFITAIAVTVVVILFTWALFHTLKKPMPRFLIPMLVGVTIIGYGIYSEYTWESRTLAQMPASFQVVHRASSTSVFSPWSYIVPRTDRLSVVDVDAIRSNPDFPDYSMFDLLLLQRFNPVIRVRQLLDCNGSRRADLTADPVFDDQGLPVNLQWQAVAEGHMLLRIACNTV